MTPPAGPGPSFLRVTAVCRMASALTTLVIANRFLAIAVWGGSLVQRLVGFGARPSHRGAFRPQAAERAWCRRPVILQS
jgi:hypothetical protein